VSNKTLYHGYTLYKDQLVMPGQFTCAGTGSVTSTTVPVSITWYGYGVTRSSTGLYTVTLSRHFPLIVALDAWPVSLTAPVRPDIILSPGNLTVSATSVISFQIQSYSITSGTAVVTDVPVGWQVHFRLDILNSTQQP